MGPLPPMKIVITYYLRIVEHFNKIAGRKRPALVDPSHKVRQGGKGSVWDGHFQSTSGSLPVHLGTIGQHL